MFEAAVPVTIAQRDHRTRRRAFTTQRDIQFAAGADREVTSGADIIRDN
jgi:hypothetical protein